MANRAVLSIPLILQSIAKYLTAQTGIENIYLNPNAQNTKLPCFFVQPIPLSGIKNSVVNRVQRTMMVDIIYINQFDLEDLYDQYIEMAEKLDLAFHIGFIYKDTTSMSEVDVQVRAYDKQYTINRDALHYKFRLDLDATYMPEDATKMQLIVEFNEYVEEVRL